MKTVKFPKGIIYHELCHYTGADDMSAINEKSDVSQRLINKLAEGAKIELEEDEHAQLIKELDNMIDIKADHVYPGEKWNGLTQYQLVKFYERVKSL